MYLKHLRLQEEAQVWSSLWGFAMFTIGVSLICFFMLLFVSFALLVKMEEIYDADDDDDDDVNCFSYFYLLL